MSESQELVTIPQNSAVALASSNYVDETGLSSVARLKPSNLLLIQPTTIDSKGGKVGQIVDVMTEEIYDRLTVVPLRVSRARVLFPPGEEVSKTPLCKSNDGEKPSPFVEYPQSASCATCPKGQWTKVDGKAKRPDCDEILKLLVIVKDLGLPRYFQVKGMSIKSLRMVLERINQDIFINEQKGNKGLRLYDYFFTIRGEKVPNKPYCIARFDEVKKVAEPGEFGPMFEKFILAAKQQAEEEEIVTAEATVDKQVSQVVEAEFVSEV